MKKFISVCAAFLLFCTCIRSASAASLTHTVVQGDTMWKLAVRYQIGTSEIIRANPQISNPNLIYPGQVLTIPQLETSVTAFETALEMTNFLDVRVGVGWAGSQAHALDYGEVG